MSNPDSVNFVGILKKLVERRLMGIYTIQVGETFSYVRKYFFHALSFLVNLEISKDQLSGAVYLRIPKNHL